MIHNDIQNQLQLLIKTSAPPLIEVADHAVGTPQWTPGQQVPAHVLASLPNGRFQVQVGDQILDLNLPRNTQPGETLELTYVANTPRLTFALLRDVPVPSSANLPVSLSETAKVIGSLLQGAPPPQTPGMSPGVLLPSSTASDRTATLAQVASPMRNASPVLLLPPEDVPVFAQALRTSLAQSGLFYESHQVQWLSGERNLASLRQEPQGQLPPLQHQAPAPQVVSRTAGPDASVTATAQPSWTGANEKTAGGAGIHPQTIPLIQQQLQALDTRQVIWQGEVWPGQQMHWEIEEELAREQGRQDDDAATWHTRLNLQLPTLGGVNVRLAFVNGMVQLDISAEAGASAALMRQHQADLAQRFSVSGLQLSGVTIQHG